MNKVPENPKVQLKAELPSGSQPSFYCPYCSNTLNYLWFEDGRLATVGLAKWLWCRSCNLCFQAGSTGGFAESELNQVVIK